VRPFFLDGALLLFDRESGTNVLFEGEELAHLRQRAPRSVQFGITNACNLACQFCSRDRAAESRWTLEEETASELREMIGAHTEWRNAWDGKTSLAESPLARFCKTQGLPWSERDGGWDDWPEHSDDNRPRVVVSGTQIIVHHEYTVSLPPTFGALFYQRGGRVEHEERHAHHSIVVTAHVYWGWTKEGRALEDAELPKLLDELTRPGGLLAQSNQEEIPSAWRAGERNGLPLTLGIVFDDLVAGIAALRTRVEAHSGKLELRLAEALSEDPLAHLRPSSPVIPRFDVVITDAGKDRAGLTRVVTEATGLYEWRASRLLESAVPITIARARFEGQAREIAGTLERAGAGVELRRNDG
jgi:ribosomal protein L7/L12